MFLSFNSFVTLGGNIKEYGVQRKGLAWELKIISDGYLDNEAQGMIRSAGGGGEHQGEGTKAQGGGVHQDRAQEGMHRGTKEEGWRETGSGERRKAGDRGVTEPQGGTGEAQCGVQGQRLLGRLLR